MPQWQRPRLLRVAKSPLSESSWSHLHKFDEWFAQPDMARGKTLEEVRAPFISVPKAEHGAEWTERVIYADCIKRMRSARVRSLFKSINGHWKQIKSPEKAEVFKQRVIEALAISASLGKPFF